MSCNSAQFRFYEELNDFLPPHEKKRDFLYEFNGKPSIKDAIEAIGAPHTEVELILVNGKSVGFDYHLSDGDRVSVYPAFESLDVSPVVTVREKPLRASSFVLDVHLGKLARLLRMLGLDALYRNDYRDIEIISISAEEHRIILTRDRGLLKNRSVTHGYCLRSTEPAAQAREVLQRFDLFSQARPFQRCMNCNGILRKVHKEEIRSEVPPKTAKYYDEFNQCRDCGKIYWKGPHYRRMKEKVISLLSKL